MTFNIKKANDWNFSEIRDISSLEDLKAIYDRFGKHQLIVDFDYYKEDMPEIIIYNDYME